MIEDCDIAVDDDAVAVKSGVGPLGIAFGKPSTNITVRRSFLHPHHGNGVRIGSESSGGVDGVLVEDTVVQYKGVAVTSCNDNMNTISNVALRNVTFVGGWIYWEPQTRSSLLCHPGASSPAHRIRLVNHSLFDVSGSITRAYITMPAPDMAQGWSFANVAFGHLRDWPCRNMAAADFASMSNVTPAPCGQVFHHPRP